MLFLQRDSFCESGSVDDGKLGIIRETCLLPTTAVATAREHIIRCPCMAVRLNVEAVGARDHPYAASIRDLKPNTLLAAQCASTPGALYEGFRQTPPSNSNSNDDTNDNDNDNNYKIGATQ